MSDRWSAPVELTVRQLVNLSALATAEVVAGEGGLDKPIRSVLMAPEGRFVADIGDRAAIVIDGVRLARDNYYVDFALRWADDNGASAVVVVGPTAEIGLASKRLANKCAIALIMIEGDTLVVADTMRSFVQSPSLVLARMLMETIEGLGRVSRAQGIQGSLSVLDQTLESRATLVGLEGGVIAGEDLSPQLEQRDRLPVQTTVKIGHRVRIVQPISLARGEKPTFWLVCERESPTAMWLEVTALAVQLAASYIATGLISDRLERERDARFRLGVLNAIIAFAEHPEPGLIQQIGTLGWKVDGWCTAIHIQVGGPVDQLRILALTDEIRGRLVECGLSGPLIERTDGWTTWTCPDKEPRTGSFADLTNAVRRALRQFAHDYEGLRVYAGVGRPYAGILGLRKSLAEAQEAGTIAQAGGGRTTVQHIDELGVERILFGWYASAEFGNFARTLLAPLMSADKEHHLMHTLQVYLDCESSPTLTADLLHLHRNTVINRVARIRELLAVDLDEPDQRLAVQLACRVVNLPT